MKQLAILLLLLAATPEIRYFRYQRAVQTAAEADGQSCLALDAAVFAHAAPGLADLRLYRDGKEIPYLIREAAPAQSGEKALTAVNLGQRGSMTAFDAEMPAGHYSDLQLEVGRKDFIATVAVSGSQQQTGLQTRLGEFTIFDLSRQRLGRSTVLHLPESDFRFLHLRFQGPLLPRDITGLSVVTVPAFQTRYRTVVTATKVLEKDHASLIEFTVPPHTPVDRIAFAPAAEPASFSRAVRVQVKPVVQAATESSAVPAAVVADGNLLRVHHTEDGHRIDEERLSVDAPTVDFATPALWTISVENGDDPPLKIDSARLEMVERDLCFEAKATGDLKLYYGDAALTAPSYDYAALFSLQTDAARSTAGPEEMNPSYVDRPDGRPFTEKHPVLLWIALIGIVGLLGAVALRSAKRRTSPAA